MSDLVHDKECVKCKKLFSCKGKPKEAKTCVCFEEKKKKE